MGEQVLKVESERAFDALIDTLPLMGKLTQAPRTKEELQASFPSLEPAAIESQISRLIKTGLVKADGDLLRATSPGVETTWQARLLTLIAEIVLPMTLSIYDEPKGALLYSLDLRLDEEQRLNLFPGPVSRFFSNLTNHSTGSTKESAEQHVMVFGTSRVPTTPHGIDRTIELLRRSARDRRDPELRAQSILSAAMGTFEPPTAAIQAVNALHDELSPFECPMEEATFSMVIGLANIRSQERAGAHP